MRMARLAYAKLKSRGPRERARRRLHREMEKRVSRDREYFASIKGKFAGQRGFVIGNGPSLKIENLDRLQGEICIASNKIYLAFETTNWRPSFYTVADPLVWDKINDIVGEMIPTVVIPQYLPNHPACTADVKTFRSIGNAPDLAAGTDKILFSDDFTHGSYGGYTVTYENLQLAVHLGLNPIYIIGCDHSYEGEKVVMANQMIASPATSNHFVKNYLDPGEMVYAAAIEQMNQSYMMAHKFANARGISLMNATRGGFLEAFPRVNFDDIVPATKSI